MSKSSAIASTSNRGTFDCAADGRPCDPLGITIREMSVLTATFILVHDLGAETLKLYHGFADSMNDNDTVRYHVCVNSESGVLDSIVVFGKTKRYCEFVGVKWPFVAVVESTYHGVTLPYVGVQKVGVTDYVTSALHVLLRVVPFVELMLETECMDGSLARELQKVFIQFIKADAAVQMRGFVNAVSDNSLQTMMQKQDVYVFLLKIFETLEAALGTDFAAARTAIFEVGGVKTDGKGRESEDMQNGIELPVSGLSSINASLYAILNYEETTFKLTKLPPFLIIRLERMKHLSHTQYEVGDFFDCPQQLDLTEFCASGVADLGHYELVVVIAHRGTGDKSQYIQFTRPTIDDEWFQFVDDTVARCSIQDVQKTYGSKNGGFFGMLSSGQTLAYLVGYVRSDCVDAFRKRPRVPANVSPIMSSSFIAKKICPPDIEGAKIYGYGNDTVWDDPNKTIGELFADDGNVDVFVAPSDVYDRAYGPISGQSKASQYVVRTGRTTFVGVPRGTGPDPVFFVANKKFFGVFDKHVVFERFTNEYEFRVGGISVTSPSDIACGAVVFGVPRDTVTIEVGKASYTVNVKMTYEAVQRLIAGDEKACRALLYSKGTDRALKPRLFPTALQLSMASPLEVRYLDSPATCGSLDHFHDVQINLYDIGHKHTKRTSIWIRNGCTVGTITAMIPEWFSFKPNPAFTYTVSPMNESAISQVFTPDETLKKSFTNIRVDVLKCEVLQTCRAIAELFRDNEPFTAIEVRALSFDQGWPKFRTLGFHMINKTDAANSFIKSHASKGKEPKPTIRGARELYKAVGIDGRDPLAGIIDRLSEQGDWAKERPILVLQMDSPPKPGQAQGP